MTKPHRELRAAVSQGTALEINIIKRFGFGMLNPYPQMLLELHVPRENTFRPVGLYIQTYSGAPRNNIVMYEIMML
jgi:hypothetical protein